MILYFAMDFFVRRPQDFLRFPPFAGDFALAFGVEQRVNTCSPISCVVKESRGSREISREPAVPVSDLSGVVAS